MTDTEHQKIHIERAIERARDGVSERIDELDQVLDLTRIDDAQTIDIPPDGVAGLSDPPVMIVAETNDAPVECGSSFSHGKSVGIFAQRARGG